MADWGDEPKPRESASPSKFSYKYIFNEPILAKDKDDATPCGLSEADFEAYVKERISASWEVVEIRLIWGNKQMGPRCVMMTIIYYREKGTR
jgi:hypothetical protein